MIANSLSPTIYDATIRENRRGDHGEEEDPMSIHRFCDALRQDAQDLQESRKVAGETLLSDDKIVVLIAKQLQQHRVKAGLPSKSKTEQEQKAKRCNHCNKQGHIARDCSEKSPSQKG